MVPAPEQTATEIMDSEHIDIVETRVDPSKSVEMDDAPSDSESTVSLVESFSNNGQDERQSSENNNSSSNGHSAAASTAVLPSLRGSMSYVGGRLVCKGKWAMTDADHANPLLTSDFEFQMVRADDDSCRLSGEFPVNGVYEGWFNVKQPPPLKPLRVEDKEMIMTFEKRDDESFIVTGKGHNAYGKFTLKGSISKDGKTSIYREYYLFNTPAAPVVRKSIEKKKKVAVAVTAASSSGAVPPPPPPTLTPRESAGRPRKPSLLMKDYQEKQQQQQAAAALREKERVKAAAVAASAAAATAKSVFPTVTSERSHRMQPALKRCGDLLRDFSKLPQSAWFLDPVDPIKFNIPEYPRIIKHPMDFSTIKNNLDRGVYESAEDFAVHMRLVFKNAITFNTDTSSLVHIAAKELGNRFEEKFRNLQMILQPELMELDAAPRIAKTPSGSSKNKNGSMTAVKRAASDKDLAARRKSLPGPRSMASTSFVPPAAMDPNTLFIMDLQKKMESMESELRTLRATVQETALKDKVDESVEAAKKPLTLDEKKALVAQIYKLQPDKMEHALDIIRESISTGPDDGEVEIPIDSLDTLTLRRLQKFIQDNTEKKKRPSAPSLSRQSSSTVREPASKKSKKSSVSKAGTAYDALLPDDSDFAMFDENEPLLFDNDQLESTPLRSDGVQISSDIHKSISSFHDDDDDDDDDGKNKWARAMKVDEEDD